MPRIARLGLHAVRTLESGLSLEPELRQLVMTQASILNGCGFCTDLERAMAVRAQLGTEKFDALAQDRTSPVFSDRERAALACGEDACLRASARSSRRRRTGP